MAQEGKKHDPFEMVEAGPAPDGDLHPEAEAVEAEAAADEGGEGADTADPEALRAEITDLRDRYLRAAAEVENIRKRADRDRRDAEQYGITRFARDILSVHDNFERAMKAVTDEARAVAGPLIEGIELTQRELLAALARHGIRKVSPEKGERFDPKLHQAMFEAPVPGTTAGEIIEVMSEGFTIGERLLRPAQVGVSSGAPAAAAEAGGAGGAGEDGAPASAASGDVAEGAAERPGG
jgi:molecular chaperone GrpE